MIIYRPALHIFCSTNSWENLVLFQGSRSKQGNQVYVIPSRRPRLTILGVDGAGVLGHAVPRCLSGFHRDASHIAVGSLLRGPCCGGQAEPLGSLKQGCLWGCARPCSWAGSAQHTPADHCNSTVDVVYISMNCGQDAKEMWQEISGESGNVGKSFYFSIIIVHQKLTGERGTKTRSPIPLLHEIPPFLSLVFYLIEGGFVDLEISLGLLQISWG